MDVPHRADYEANTRRFLAKLERLDQAIMEAMKTIPEGNRKLLTYHDSFAYFCPRYGCTVIGAIQPSSFSQPSPREVARLIDQIRNEKIPAIFGSEVFPSKVLDQIGKEGGVKFIDTLSDDDLPGTMDDPNHSYIGMMLGNIGTMVRALGGDPSALKGVDAKNVN
jgi:zinc/manganese transport system substrate-binding protein/manganese/iron transport system substrate-binding protein